MIERTSEIVLDGRKSAVLKAIIKEHIQTGEPVGSRTVSRATRLDLSPASIRNIMAELEDMGLLSRPHASAGGVPTDRAYRLFVDNMISMPQVAAAEEAAVDLGVQGLHAASEHLGEAGVLTHLGHGQARVLQLSGGARRGEQRDAAVMQSAAEFDDTGLVVGGEQGSRNRCHEMS